MREYWIKDILNKIGNRFDGLSRTYVEDMTQQMII
jgi:hypothetical protein